MSETAIRDRFGNIIGYVDTDGDGNQKVRDKNQQIIGYTNEDGTYDKYMKRISDAAIGD